MVFVADMKRHKALFLKNMEVADCYSVSARFSLEDTKRALLADFESLVCKKLVEFRKVLASGGTNVEIENTYFARGFDKKLDRFLEQKPKLDQPGLVCEFLKQSHFDLDKVSSEKVLYVSRLNAVQGIEKSDVVV